MSVAFVFRRLMPLIQNTVHPREHSSELIGSASESTLRDALLREQRMRNDADAAARSAQLASRMKDEFLATLSHELRTPLNAILGWTQTLRCGESSPDTLSRALSQIEQSARAQARLIDDLLNVSDIVAGRLRLDIQPVRLVRSVNAVIEAMHPAVEAKSIRLETDFDSHADVVYGDPARLQQVFWNLLANAVKFTPTGGSIRVALSREGTQACLSITDSGEGIKPEFLPLVFERFTQADASSRKRHGGLGIGLAIARYLVELHGGTIEAKSDGEGRGATFKVRLHLHSSHRASPAPEAGQPEYRPSASRGMRSRSLAGLRILTVDDDTNTREMLKAALEHAGATVVTAESARDALEKLKAFKPQLLVSDIGMPTEDGYDLLRQVRALPTAEGGSIPAVALTGFAREEDRALTWRAGYQAVTPKPVNLDELIETLAALARCD
jgi:signal transduction histidine kinase/CheY-like chemotaxis protein